MFIVRRYTGVRITPSNPSEVPVCDVLLKLNKTLKKFDSNLQVELFDDLEDSNSTRYKDRDSYIRGRLDTASNLYDAILQDVFGQKKKKRI